MTSKKLLKSQIIKVLQQITSSFRDSKVPDDKRKYTDDKVAAIYSAARTMFDDTNSSKLMKLISLVMDAPELESCGKFETRIGCVVVLEESETTHAYPLHTPLMASTAHKHLLFKGSLNTWTYSAKSKPRYATDEEIVQCVNDWSDGDLFVIMTNNDCRDAIIREALEMDVELTEETKSEEVEIDFTK